LSSNNTWKGGIVPLSSQIECVAEVSIKEISASKIFREYITACESASQDPYVLEIKPVYENPFEWGTCQIQDHIWGLSLDLLHTGIE